MKYLVIRGGVLCGKNPFDNAPEAVHSLLKFARNADKKGIKANFDIWGLEVQEDNKPARFIPFRDCISYGYSKGFIKNFKVDPEVLEKYRARKAKPELFHRVQVTGFELVGTVLDKIFYGTLEESAVEIHREVLTHLNEKVHDRLVGTLLDDINVRYTPHGAKSKVPYSTSGWDEFCEKYGLPRKGY